jgi:hypothetical protein
MPRTKRPRKCPTHGVDLVRGAWCPACRGALGGRRRSKAKTIAARENARRPRPNRRVTPNPSQEA